MNKMELIQEVSERAGLAKKDAEKALNALLDTVADTLASGDKVQLVGFGSFETKAREARNRPATPRPRSPLKSPPPRCRCSRRAKP